MKIYVIHYDKLSERKSRLEDSLRANALTAEWLIQTGFYSSSVVSNFFSPSRDEWKRKTKIAKRPIIFRNLTRSEIHLGINHFLVGERIANGPDEVALVLEDDAVLPSDFRVKLFEVFEQLSQCAWDVAFLDFLGGTPPSAEHPFILRARGRFDYFGTCAFLVRRDAWRSMLDVREKFTLPIDEEIKYRINRLKLHAVWVVPPLIRQSSLEEPSRVSGQDAREVAGVKRYLAWRKPIYARLPRTIRERIYQAELFVKRMVLGIH